MKETERTVETQTMSKRQSETLAQILEVVIPQIKNVKTFADLEKTSNK